MQVAQATQKVGVRPVMKKAQACTVDETLLDFYAQGHTLQGKPCGCFTSSGTFADGQECVRMLEQAFRVALKMKIAPGLVLESKDVLEGNLGPCSEFALRMIRELA
jgi:hypothetical protein